MPRIPGRRLNLAAADVFSCVIGRVNVNCLDCAGSAERGVTGDPDRTSGARGAAQLGGRFESSRWRPRNTLGVRAGEASIELFLVFCWVFVGFLWAIEWGWSAGSTVLKSIPARSLRGIEQAVGICLAGQRDVRSVGASDEHKRWPSFLAVCCGFSSGAGRCGWVTA